MWVRSINGYHGESAVNQVEDFASKLTLVPDNNYIGWREKYLTHVMQKFGADAESAIVTKLHPIFDTAAEDLKIAFKDVRRKLFSDMVIHLSEESLASVRKYNQTHPTTTTMKVPALVDTVGVTYAAALAEKDFIQLWTLIEATHLLKNVAAPAVEEEKSPSSLIREGDRFLNYIERTHQLIEVLCDDSEKERQLKEEAVDTLYHIANGYDESVRREVVAALIPQLAGSFDENNVHTKKWVSYALGYLADDNAINQQMIAAEGGITALISILADCSCFEYTKTYPYSSAAKKEAAKALRNLAAGGDGNNHRKVIITTLIALLADSSYENNIDAKMHAAYALGSLAFNDASNQQAIVNEGGIAALVSMLADCSDEYETSLCAKEEAVSTLQHLCAGDDAAMSRKVISKLIAVLTDSYDQSGSDGKQWAANMMGRLVRDNVNNQQVIAEEGGISALITLLTACSEQTCYYANHEAASMLECLAAGDDGNARREFIVTTLISILKDTSDKSSADTRLWAASGLGSLSCDPANRQAIAAKGGVTALIALLTDFSDKSSADAKAVAAYSLALFATYANEKRLVAAEGGIAALLALLADSSDKSYENTKRKAAVALRSLSDGTDENTSREVISSLIASLSDSSALAKQWAAFTLESLVRYGAVNKHLIVEEGGVPALIAMLRDSSDQSSDDAKTEAIEALGQLASIDRGIQRLIFEEGGATALIALFCDRSSCDRKVSSNSLLALERMFNTDETATLNDPNYKQLVADEGDIAALIALLSEPHDHGKMSSKKNAVYVLNAIAKFNDGNRQLIVALGGVPALVAVLRGLSNLRQDWLKERTTELLLKLAENSDEVLQLIAAEGALDLLK